MTRAQVDKIANCLLVGKRIAAIKAIREADGSSLREAKLKVDLYLPLHQDVNDPSKCVAAALQFRTDHMDLCPDELTFEHWFQAGIDAGYFALINQIRGA